MSPSSSQSTLTRQQRQAMEAFVGNGGTASDSSVWLEGVRPWPTMANLAKAGLVVETEWLGEEDGWEYRVTRAGADYLIRERGVSDRLALELRYVAGVACA